MSTRKDPSLGDVPPALKVGRPTKYDPSILGDIPAMYAEGQADVEVATELGIAESTFYLWIKEHKEFSEAVKLGRQVSHAWWLARGRRNLAGRDFNSTLWYMNMKNRHGWKDRQDVTSDEKPILTAPIRVTIHDPKEETDERDSSD